MNFVDGKVVSGHGVASGKAGDPRFPDGTLGLQWGIFQQLGLNLDGFFRGTVNVSVAPRKPILRKPLHTFRSVKWHPDCPPEDFSFFEIRITVGAMAPVSGYVYWPHPETKPEHFQDPHIVEVLAPKLPGISEGGTVRLDTDPNQMTFE